MDQEQSSLFMIILFNIIVLLLNILVQRGPVSIVFRFVRSACVGIVVISIFLFTIYLIEGPYHSLIMVAVITMFLNAMGVGLVVWFGYVIFGLINKKESRKT